MSLDNSEVLAGLGNAPPFFNNAITNGSSTSHNPSWGDGPTPCANPCDAPPVNGKKGANQPATAGSGTDGKCSCWDACKPQGTKGDVEAIHEDIVLRPASHTRAPPSRKPQGRAWAVARRGLANRQDTFRSYCGLGRSNAWHGYQSAAATTATAGQYPIWRTSF